MMTYTIIQKWLTPNKYSRPQTKLKGVKGIVVHWWASPNGAVNGVWNFYENRKSGRNSYGSAHYIIGLDGNGIQCIPENEMAYGAGASKYYTNRLGSYPNNETLHIEMAHTDWNGNMTKETWDSSVQLVTKLLKKYGLGIDDIYRHYDITHKDCPKLFVNHPEKFEEFKKDVAEILNPKTHQTQYVETTIYYKDSAIKGLIDDGITFVQLRQLADLLNIPIDYNAQTNTVYFNGKVVKPLIIDGRSYMKARETIEGIGKKVNWDGKNVHIVD